MKQTRPKATDHGPQRTEVLICAFPVLDRDRSTRAVGIPSGRVEGRYVNGRTAVPLHPPLGRVRLERNRDVGLSESHRRDYRAAVNQFCFTGRGTHEVHA